jgi:AcrR family transcriptional regulator
VLDAYARLLIEGGEKAATMDAAASAAGVSKGGLLYHFPSKEALESALVERLRVLAEEDVVAMTSAPEGPVAAFVRSSVVSGTPFDRTIIAVSRLAQSGHENAAAALRDMRVAWEDVVRPHVRDRAALDLVILLGDGLYFNKTLEGDSSATPVPAGDDLDALVALVERVTAR